MANPLISIVMPVYNGSYSITKVITSLLRQTYKNFELVIVNDGSTDDTQRMISRFKDPRITVFTHTKNRGICYALNLGILKSKGEFIARADGDDKSMSQRLQKQLNFLTNHPDYDVCGTFQNIWEKRL
jgi:glycosyltransferase involved in cell wall biosynthesis